MPIQRAPETIKSRQLPPVRMPEAAYKRLLKAAATEAVTVSEFIRRSIIESAAKTLKGRDALR